METTGTFSCADNLLKLMCLGNFKSCVMEACTKFDSQNFGIALGFAYAEKFKKIIRISFKFELFTEDATA